MTTRVLALTLVETLALAAAAAAQTPTVPVALGKPCALGTNPTALTRSFQSGDWKAFRNIVVAIRKQINANAECKSADGTRIAVGDGDYLLVAWIGETALGDTALLTAVVHETDGEGYVSRLPGLSAGQSPALHQIFVSGEQQDVLAAVYMSTREQNPLLKQIPDVAESILDPMLALLSANMGTERSGLARAPAAGWATVSRVDLPYKRAAVKVEMKAQLSPVAGLTKASAKLKSTLTLIDVRYSDAGKKLAGELDAILRENADDCSVAKPPNGCLALVDPEFSAKYNAACGANCSGDLEKALQTVDAKFRALAATGASQKLDGKAELRNVPLTRFSFGLMTGFSFLRSSSAPRVEVDDGVLEHDPLARTLTMATFNGAFRAYDADAFSMTRAERHRWFVGAAITPSFGVGVGYSFIPVRGLGINVGYAVLGISVADGGKEIGEAPENTEDPFELGVTGTAFIGVSYNFR